MQLSIPMVQALFPELAALRPLGEGGQKWVFACETNDGRPAVLKLIKPHADLERIQREIQAVVAVKCPRVPHIYHADIRDSVVGSLVWLLEEFVPGDQLRAVINASPLSVADAKRLATHVLEALAAAESARVIHRDVKPDNIVCDPTGNFWLLDFGIARHLDLESLTASGQVGGVGTLGYAPPEQFQNKKRELDARADLFALGATLYEAVTGANHFRVGAKDAFEVCQRVENSPLPRLQLKDDVGGRFDAFVRTLAQPRRDHRPESAQSALDWARTL